MPRAGVLKCGELSILRTIAQVPQVLTVNVRGVAEVVELRGAVAARSSLLHPNPPIHIQNVKKDRAKSVPGPSSRCGAEGIRTPDLLIANETRYQLRHSPLMRQEL